MSDNVKDLRPPHPPNANVEPPKSPRIVALELLGHVLGFLAAATAITVTVLLAIAAIKAAYGLAF